jgi:hypothetical protein
LTGILESLGRVLGWVKTRPVVLLVVVALGAGLAAGYHLGRRPTRQVEKAKTTATASADTSSTEKREEKRATARRALVERFDPATGILIERRTERERELSGVTAAVERQAHTEASATAERERVVEQSRASLRLRLDAGWSRLAPRPDVWGGAVELRVAGPVWVGAGYGSDKVARLSAAWEF